MEEKIIKSVNTGHEHRIRVWVPQDANSENCYPVLYMMDGQNVFYDEESFSGHCWGILSYMESLPLEKQWIIVGIDNSARRYEEYSPWINEKPKTSFHNRVYGGDGAKYAQFIAHEVKPYVDAHFATKQEKEYTAIMGSSMGAFIATYTAMRFPEIFGKLGCLSIASWFAEEQFLDFVRNTPLDPNQKIYLYVGSDENSDSNILDMNEWYMANTQNLYNLLAPQTQNLKYVFLPGGKHNEECWHAQLPACLDYLEASRHQSF